MKKLKLIPAYIWAAACLLLVPITFVRNNDLAVQLAKLPFMKIHPKYTGGMEKRSYLTNGLLITVYEPVYNGITGKGSRGFVQVKFSGTGQLPGTIHELIDYDFDGNPDFSVSINTANGTTSFEKMNRQVNSLRISAKVKNDWVVQVNLKRE
jgi:hypothetical protein